MKVLLTIDGVQTEPGGHEQETSVSCEAYCEAGGDGCLFRYTADGERASLFLSRTCAWIEREGGSGAQMIFDPSVPATKCDYGTPFGTIPMEIRTDRIVVMGRGNTPGIFTLRGRIKYTLKLDGDYYLKCSVTIKAQQIQE